MADSVNTAPATDYSHGQPQNEIIENYGDKITDSNIDSGTSKAKQDLASVRGKHGGRRVGPIANELDALEATENAMVARLGKVVYAVYVDPGTGSFDDEPPCRLIGDTLKMNRNHPRVKKLNEILESGEKSNGLNLAVELLVDHALKNPLKPNEPNKPNEAVWMKCVNRLACCVVWDAARTAFNELFSTCGDNDSTGL